MGCSVNSRNGWLFDTLDSQSIPGRNHENSHISADGLHIWDEKHHQPSIRLWFPKQIKFR
jgi:hypothetical protein